MATEVVAESSQENAENRTVEKRNMEGSPDLTISVNTSALNESSVTRVSEDVYKFGFSLKDLYKISLEFYRKEKDSIQLSYDDKVRLVALWKQVSNGKYDESKMPEIGYFDVIGNDRRKAWQSLGEMASDVAKKEFCDILESKVSTYTTFVETRKQEIEAEIERKRKEEEERLRKEEEERKRKEEEERIRKEEEERIRLALEAEKLKIKAENEQREKDETDAKSVSQSDPKLVTPQVNGASGKAIAPASLWTRPKLPEFINHVKRDASSVLVVGRGETVTIRVPTHEHGSCLFWEFATESYDVGFGVYFEWADNKNKEIMAANKGEAVNKDNPEDKSDKNVDTSTENKPIDQIIIHENENNVEIDINQPDEILPVLRRNSHEEVIVGSHMYPGQVADWFGMTIGCCYGCEAFQIVLCQKSENTLKSISSQMLSNDVVFPTKECNLKTSKFRCDLNLNRVNKIGFWHHSEVFSFQELT